MDRVQVLIEKLLTQRAANESPAKLQVTVHLLHEELLRLQQEPYVGTSKKVVVVLPSIISTVIQTISVAENVVATPEILEEKKLVLPVVPAVEPKEEKPVFRQPSFFDVQEDVPVIRQEPVKPLEEPKETEPVKETYVLRKPSFFSQEPAREESKIQHNSAQPFNVVDETPTLSQRQPLREVHEVIGAKEASLNDKLKQEKTELVNVLKDTPIKDLRKGIGVNDKFLFINELFRGDENLYEKSIKTINAFHILPEAEYWINRELKIKLGWNDDKEVVQYFYQLVKRRFS
jgi:hypothetical protein